MTTSLHDWLPAEQGPWHLDFEQWPQAQAQRWRAVLAVGAGGRRLLLAERDEDALLLLWVLQGRLATRWGFFSDDAVDDLQRGPSRLYPDVGLTSAQLYPADAEAKTTGEP